MFWQMLLDVAPSPENQAGANFWLAVVFISAILFTIGMIMSQRWLRRSGCEYY